MHEIYNDTTKQSFKINCGNSANAHEVCKVLNAFKADGTWSYRAVD